MYSKFSEESPFTDFTPIFNVYMPIETLIRREPNNQQEQGYAAMHHIVNFVDWLQWRNGVPW